MPYEETWFQNPLIAQVYLVCYKNDGESYPDGFWINFLNYLCHSSTWNVFQDYSKLLGLSCQEI